jgi:polyisoprenyl-teichoic acid--peptidoglycan teichoic acid transferase
MALAFVAIAASGALMGYRYLQIDRVETAEGTLEDEAHGEPQNFLLIGSDSRAFVEVDKEAEAYGTADEVGPPKADVILIARTFPDEGRIALMSLPRDLWLPIAGTGREERINTAIEHGIDRLIETVNTNFGIPIHHIVQIDFRGFKGLVYAVGGVDVYFPSPVRDWDHENDISPTGLNIPDAGCVRLNGDVALAYVRSRHYERFIDGHWQPDPTGDLNRIVRQQDFIRRTLRQALSRGLTDPRRLDSVAASADDFVQLDENLGVFDILRFGEQFRSLSPDSLETYSLPTAPHVAAGGAQVLLLQAEAAKPVLDVFRGVVDRPNVLLPGSVRLNIVDAAGGRNRLQVAAFRLAAAGFVVANTGDSESTARPTVIRYGAGQRAKADLLATALVDPVELVEDSSLVGVDLVLELGRDFAGVKEATSPVTTTAPATTAAPDGPASAPSTTAAEQVPATPEC